MIRILVTGSRDLDEHAPKHYKPIHTALWEVCVQYRVWDPATQRVHDGTVTVVQGGARGADRIARQWAEAHGAAWLTYAAQWSRWGRVAGIIRNGDMVRAGAHICLAFPMGPSPGTYDCVRRADAVNIPTRITLMHPAPIRLPDGRERR